MVLTGMIVLTDLWTAFLKVTFLGYIAHLLLIDEYYYVDFQQFLVTSFQQQCTDCVCSNTKNQLYCKLTSILLTSLSSLKAKNSSPPDGDFT